MVMSRLVIIGAVLLAMVSTAATRAQQTTPLQDRDVGTAAPGHNRSRPRTRVDAVPREDFGGTSPSNGSCLASRVAMLNGRRAMLRSTASFLRQRLDELKCLAKLLDDDYDSDEV
jgi:hypothetical protein